MGASDSGDDANDDASSDDPLTCREKLPSPPSALFDDEEELITFSPEATSTEDYDAQRGAAFPIPNYMETMDDTGVVSSNAALFPKSLSSYQTLSSRDTNSAPTHHKRMKLPRRRSGRSPVPVKLPGSSPVKLAPPRKRARAGRPLPTASSRKITSLRGGFQNKRAFPHDEHNPDPASSKPRFGKNKRASSASAADADALLKSSMQLAYSWDSLGLGKELGSAAMNEYMGRLRKSEEGSPYLPYLTAQEMLQVINSLRVRTYLPPPGSSLHRIVQKNRFENRPELYGAETRTDVHSTADDLGESVNTEDNPLSTSNARSQSTVKGSSRQTPDFAIPFKDMARLYETMCAQDADDGSFNRRETQYLSASATAEKLRGLENRACELKLKESTVLQEGKELGLLDATNCLMPGYAQVPDGDRLVSVSARSKEMLRS